MSKVAGTLRRAVRPAPVVVTAHGVCLLLALSLAPLQAQEAKALLRWKNGDVLAGKLLQSKSGQIHWSSPHFSDDLVVDANVLHSITFPEQSVHPTEAFRVGTVSGDVFTADLVGSSDDAFLFSSKRHGRFQVKRDAVYSLSRAANPNLAFDGSQFREWERSNDGPIRDFTYKVYKGDWEWGAAFPDLTKLTPTDEGRLAAGYLDLGLSRFRERFAMSFAGDIVIPTAGKYRFDGTMDDRVHLWIDGKKIGNDAVIAHRHKSIVELAEGSHSLRLDYIDFGGEARLSFWMVNPNGESKSLAAANRASGWWRGIGGHPQTDRKKASIFGEVELPKYFEIDLEIASSTAPQFVLAIGKDRLSAESNQSLRVETWGDELVVVQDKIFEPVMTIAKAMREVRLRLAFDSDTGALQVFDASGNSLVNVKGVRATTGKSGIYVRNRGEDLTVRRLSVYRQSNAGVRQKSDSTKSRVHMIDGQVVYGRLFVTESGAYVIDQDETRREVALSKVDRIARPGVKLAATANVTELTYADGTIVRGRVEQANSDEVMLRTAFSDTPVTCALAGASSLRFGPSAPESEPPSGDMDQLFTASGRLRGRLTFDLAGSPLSWRPEGAAKPLRLANTGAARVERNSQSVTQGPSFDTDKFPYVLHLKNGEVIPCQVSSYDKTTLGFQSPFIKQRKMDSAHVKAIEFTPSKNRDPEDESSSEIDDWLKEILGPEQKTSLGIDPVKLDRALTVPRFRRDNPPSHILVAKNGDMKRGSLLGISGQTIQFESKLRKLIVPVARMARVVNVSKPEEELDEPSEKTTDLTGKVRATLADGSVLIFAATESRDGKLVGRSSIYGEMAIPIESIQDLNIGNFEKEKFKSLFEEWVVHPAREPEFGKPSPPADKPPNSEGPAASSPVAVPPMRDQALDVDRSVAVDTPAERSRPSISMTDRKAPDLGKVHIDARDRSLRFPISINQRSGPVEYALVTDQGKTHESVFRTDTEPTHIHLGLLLLGATPSYARELPTDPSRKLPGEPVHIEIAWTEGVVERIKPLGAFIVTTNNAATLAPGPWVYNGSVLTGNGIAAQMAGSIVSLWLDPGALINNPRPGRENDELHHANPPAFPADPTRLQMVVRLAKDRQLTAGSD